MKIASLIARNLLGLMFLVFGLNGFLNFIPMPAPTGLALEFVTVMAIKSHYMAVVFFFQVIGGVILLSNRFVPLGLTILGPVIVNILLFHLFIEPAGIGNALVATVLWFVVFASERAAFQGLFVARSAETSRTARSETRERFAS